MRKVLTKRPMYNGIAAAVWLVASAASTGAFAQARCPSASDQAAFEVGALKSQMIVLAESCTDADKSYNAFIERYRPELTSQDRVVNAWFKKVYGKAAQREYDSYITNLINSQSQNGLKQGTTFCPRTRILFSEAMALPSATVLAQYAAGKDLVPSDLGSCVAPPAPLPRVPEAKRHKS